jgi:hypothetical protein
MVPESTIFPVSEKMPYTNWWCESTPVVFIFMAARPASRNLI